MSYMDSERGWPGSGEEYLRHEDSSIALRDRNLAYASSYNREKIAVSTGGFEAIGPNIRKSGGYIHSGYIDTRVAEPISIVGGRWVNHKDQPNRVVGMWYQALPFETDIDYATGNDHRVIPIKNHLSLDYELRPSELLDGPTSTAPLTHRSIKTLSAGLRFGVGRGADWTPEYPSGVQGINVVGTDYDGIYNYFLACAPAALFADHRSYIPGLYSTHVFDLDGDDASNRHSGLDSIFKVHAFSTGLGLHGSFGICLFGGRTVTGLGYLPMSQQGFVAGPAPDKQPITQNKSNKNGSIYIIGGQAISSAKGRRSGTPPTVIGLFSSEGGGPLFAGIKGGDEHEVGLNGEGEPINLGKISTSALFQSELPSYAKKYDMPIRFRNEDEPPEVIEMEGYPVRVYMMRNPSVDHNTVLGEHPGMWDFWVPAMIEPGSGGSFGGDEGDDGGDEDPPDPKKTQPPDRPVTQEKDKKKPDDRDKEEQNSDPDDEDTISNGIPMWYKGPGAGTRFVVPPDLGSSKGSGGGKDRKKKEQEQKEADKKKKEREKKEKERKEKKATEKAEKGKSEKDDDGDEKRKDKKEDKDDDDDKKDKEDRKKTVEAKKLGIIEKRELNKKKGKLEKNLSNINGAIEKYERYKEELEGRTDGSKINARSPEIDEDGNYTGKLKGTKEEKDLAGVNEVLGALNDLKETKVTQLEKIDKREREHEKYVEQRRNQLENGGSSNHDDQGAGNGAPARGGGGRRSPDKPISGKQTKNSTAIGSTFKGDGNELKGLRGLTKPVITQDHSKKGWMIGSTLTTKGFKNSSPILAKNPPRTSACIASPGGYGIAMLCPSPGDLASISTLTSWQTGGAIDFLFDTTGIPKNPNRGANNRIPTETREALAKSPLTHMDMCWGEQTDRGEFCYATDREPGNASGRYQDHGVALSGGSHMSSPDLNLRDGLGTATNTFMGVGTEVAFTIGGNPDPLLGTPCDTYKMQHQAGTGNLLLEGLDEFGITDQDRLMEFGGGGLLLKPNTTPSSTTPGQMFYDSSTDDYHGITVADGIISLTTGSPGTIGANSIIINQVAHGISTGEWAFYNDPNYGIADASDKDKMAIGLVNKIDDDCFELHLGGYIPPGIISGLTAGFNWLTSSGGFTPTKPVTGNLQAVFLATAADEGYITNYQPYTQAGGGGADHSGLTLNTIPKSDGAGGVVDGTITNDGAGIITASDPGGGSSNFVYTPADGTIDIGNIAGVTKICMDAENETLDIGDATDMISLEGDGADKLSITTGGVITGQWKGDGTLTTGDGVTGSNTRLNYDPALGTDGLLEMIDSSGNTNASIDGNGTMIAELLDLTPGSEGAIRHPLFEPITINYSTASSPFIPDFIGGMYRFDTSLLYPTTTPTKTLQRSGIVHLINPTADDSGIGSWFSLITDDGTTTAKDTLDIFEEDGTTLVVSLTVGEWAFIVARDTVSPKYFVLMAGSGAT